MFTLYFLYEATPEVNSSAPSPDRKVQLPSRRTSSNKSAPRTYIVASARDGRWPAYTYQPYMYLHVLTYGLKDFPFQIHHSCCLHHREQYSAKTALSHHLEYSCFEGFSTLQSCNMPSNRIFLSSQLVAGYL